MSGLGTCRDCNSWIYWADFEDESGKTRHVPYDEPGHFTMHWQTCEAGDYIEVGRTAYRVERCRNCKQRVYWETTRNGKKRQMDCYQDEDGEWQISGDCHFDTCVSRRGPGASDTWREADRQRRAKQEPVTATANGHTTTEIQRLVRLWGPDLGITWPCTREQVTSAFRTGALKHHPDMGGQAKDFIRVKRAYDALRNQVPV